MTVRALLTSRARYAGLAVAVVIAVGLGALLAPRPVTLGTSSSGDTALAARVRAVSSGEERRGMSVAVLDDGELRQAGLGEDGTGAAVTPSTPFEIGSVTKTLTASLFADLVAGGVVEPDDTVREVLPKRAWRRGGAGDATLAELASQRSGLPTLPLTPRTLVGTYGYTFLRTDPDVGSPEDVIDAADEARRGDVGQYSYSNLGFALLGHVLAERAGSSYPRLLRERLLDPLGMRDTAIPHPTAGPPPGVARGHTRTGQQRAPGVSDGGAPAGWGVWSTTADLARFGATVMAGSAPGADAARQRFPADEDRIGYAWHTTRTSDGDSVVWHNGKSGGCSAFLGFDRAERRVVVVLNNTDSGVDAIGRQLLDGSPADEVESSPPVHETVIGAGLPPVAGLYLLAASLGGWRPGKRRVPDRAGLLGTTGWSVLAFVVSYAAGALDWLTIAGWSVGAALTGVAVFVTAASWRELPWNAAKRRLPHWIGSAAGALVGVASAVAIAL